MLKVILWDNDGLLVDTEELYFSVTREVLSEVGIDLTLEMFIEISLTRGQSAFDLAVDQGFDQEIFKSIREVGVEVLKLHRPLS
jgi:beta-phosphoglucomutase-like phosphatase (HAD superfamily)